MSYTEVNLVRHATATHMSSPDIVAGRAPFSTLTEEGVQQARQLGETWATEGYEPDVADSSPLIRAQNTLQIAQQAGAILRSIAPPVPDLAEQCLGYHEGRQRGDVYSPYLLWMIELQGGLFRHQGLNQEGIPGESLLDASRRIASYMIGLREAVSDPPNSVVAMSHKIAMQGFFTYLQLGGLEGPLNPHELKRGALDRSVIDITPCSQSLVVIEGGPDPTDIRMSVKYIGKHLEV